MATILAAVAGVLSALLALGERHLARKTPLYLAAAWWLLLRMSIDFLGGFGSFFLLNAAFGKTDWYSPFYISVLVPGLIGPAILRSQLSLLGSGEDNAFGPARMLSKVRKWLDDAIDEVCAAARSAWVHDVALPAVEGWPVDELVGRAITYYSGLGRLAESTRKSLLEYLNAVAAETATDDGVRRRAVVLLLVGNRGHRMVAEWVAASEAPGRTV